MSGVISLNFINIFSVMGRARHPAVVSTGSYRIIPRASAISVLLPQQVAMAQSTASLVSSGL